MVGDKRLILKSRTRPYYFRRCKRVMATNIIESLPDDLLFHILVRLPDDYLYERARLVCGRWYHIIHSHAFVNTHAHHSTYGLLLSAGGHLIFVSATAQGRIETFEFSYKYRTGILGSCNGLAMEYRLRTVHIINPATKQLFVLPSFSSDLDHYNRCGIAYAAASMECKVTLPYWVVSLSSSSSGLAILTLGVDNSWRHVPVEHLSGHTKALFGDYPLTTERFIHWTLGSTKILSLNVETEVFIESEVTLPRVYHYKTRKYYLSTGRYLSLLVPCRDFVWEVWGLKPETGEWRKLPDINLEAQKCRLKQFARGRDEVLEPLGWIKYPEVLALRFPGGGRTCIFYNLDTHEINSTELPGPCVGYRAFVHKNSLEWLT